MFKSVIWRYVPQGPMLTQLPNGNHRNGCNGKDDRDDWRRDVERLVDMRLRQIFFKDEFDAVGKRLQQAERSNPRGPPAVLDARRHLALQPDAIRHRRQQNKHDGNRLDKRNDDERRYAQLCPCGAGALARVLLIFLFDLPDCRLVPSPPQLPTRRICFRKPNSESLNTDQACPS